MLINTRQIYFVAFLVASLKCIVVGDAFAQSPVTVDSLFPPPPARSQATRDAIRPSYVDARTRWAFRAISPVTVHSSIVRLGDVARPLDPDMAGWQRLSRAVIGLVPLGGQTMTIQRERLTEAIKSAEATACAIDWIGDESISVTYRPLDDANGNPAVIQTSGSMLESASPAQNRAITTPDSSVPYADPIVIKRLVYWIELAIGRDYPQVAEAYALTIEPKQNSLHMLQAVGGIDHVEFLSEKIGDGKHRMSVTGRSVDGPIKAEIEIALNAHPVAIVTKDSFPRGHRFQSHDLTTRPIPEEKWDDRFVTDPDELLGMEARSTVRENVPIKRESYGKPILIRRGDRIEVRVIGGGINVTTNGRSLEEGSESDLIEVETIEPRKQLIARVAGPGLVEILTRPPGVAE